MIFFLDDKLGNPFSSDEEEEDDDDNEADEDDNENGHKPKKDFQHENTKLFKSFNASNWRKNRHEREQFVEKKVINYRKR